MTPSTALGTNGFFNDGIQRKMRLAFMGTPDFAVPTLDALQEAGHEIAMVYSQPPRRAGRGKKLTPTPVDARAQELGLEVRTPISLKSEDEHRFFAALDLDVAVVAAYGLILPQPILDAPKLGCLNVHASLLPRWRGAAPVQRAILAGDEETGVTIMQMEAGLDTGPMLAMAATPIADRIAGEITDELAVRGAALMAEVLASPRDFPREKQPEHGATYASKIDKTEARLDLSADAAAVERQIRAFNPVPGAFFEHDGERYRIHAAQVLERSGTPGTVIDDELVIACGSGAIRPTLIQRAGRPAMALEEFLRGNAISMGSALN